MKPLTEKLLNEAVNSAVEYALSNERMNTVVSGKRAMRHLDIKDKMTRSKAALISHLESLERWADASIDDFSTGSMLSGKDRG